MNTQEGPRDGADDESGTLTIEGIEKLAAMCSTFFGNRLRFLIASIRELEAGMKRQAASATMGMDAAKAAGAEYYRLGKQALDEAGRLAAQTSFEELESQRKANAMLTAEIAALEAERDALRAAVKKARKAALEEALIACNGEALEDPTGSADDIAYDLAVEDCRNAIRAIAAKEPANGQG